MEVRFNMNESHPHSLDVCGLQSEAQCCVKTTCTGARLATTTSHAFKIPLKHSCILSSPADPRKHHALQIKQRFTLLRIYYYFPA